MRINTNTAAMNTYSRLTSAQGSQANSLAKLSSGLRINKAGDDAAGLSISEKMRNQISGLKQATRNAQDGISLIQTAEGALNETHSILNRMRDLTVQASNDTNTDDDRNAIQKEINSLSDEIQRIAEQTQFNTKGLLNGDTTITVEDAVPSTPIVVGDLTDNNGLTAMIAEADEVAVTDAATMVTHFENASDDEKQALIDAYNGASATNELDSTSLIGADAVTKEASSFTFQIGSNAKENIDIVVNNMSKSGLGIESLNVETKGSDDQVSPHDATKTGLNNFDVALEKIDNAIKMVSEQRADLGATQNRLEHTVSNLTTTRENLAEANSRIRDVDMAEEMMEFTKNNILSQASTAMLAQANQMPQGVLQLLG